MPRAFVVTLLLALASACGAPAREGYGASFQPAQHAPVLKAALLVRTDGELDALRASGAELIGWHTLPTELIPLEREVLAGAKPSALREGCEIHAALGTVTCGLDFQVGTYSYTGTPANVCVTVGGDGPQPQPPDCVPLD